MICLIIPFYKDKHFSRHREIMTCLRKNLSNSLIDRVFAVCDTDIKISYHHKLTIINIGKRQLFSHLSNLGNVLNSDGINIVANADIYFKKEDIDKILKVDFTNTVLALSRWDGNKHYSKLDSQDVWVFKGQLRGEFDFELGRAGIDNRIAYEIGLNYNIINPSCTIKSYHLHLSNLRTYSKKKKDAIPPPYLRVPVCNFSDKPIRKVLHVGMNAKGQTALSEMLKSFGKYEYFDWQKELKTYELHGMRERLIDLSKKFKPDFTFMQIQTSGIIDAITASQLHGFTLNWSGDVRQPIPDWFKDLAPYVDVTCLTNETDTEQLRQEGINSWFLQIGFEHNLFTPKGRKLSKGIHEIPDVVFMGNNYQDKFPYSKERYEIAHTLRRNYGNKFLLCGQGWDIPAINLMGRMKDEAMVYRSCKIAINANHFLHKRFSSDRIFRIMGSGAFCLTRWYPGIEKDFIEGEHLRTFNNLDEMIYLINYYLKHDDEREYISDQGCKLVHEKYTWMANKRLIQQIASFPQEKKVAKDTKILIPMSNKEWRQYLKTP